VRESGGGRAHTSIINPSRWEEHDWESGSGCSHWKLQISIQSAFGGENSKVNIVVLDCNPNYKINILEYGRGDKLPCRGI
jgi:hypothetical protein